MDIIKFNNPNEKTLMESGELINGLTSKMWVERYRDAGEFTLIAPTSTQLRTKLPIGSFITHTNTQEIMIVENHEITEDLTKDATIKITGRSFETILDNRIVGSNKNFPVQNQVVDITLAANYLPAQIVTFINSYIGTSGMIDSNDTIPHVIALTDMPSGVGSYEARTFQRDTVYNVVRTLLKLDNLGIKSLRWRPGSLYNQTWTELVVHQGVNIASDKAIFSPAEGGIETADYLYSNKNVKNTAIVTSKWFEIAVKDWNGTYGGYDRRVLYVNASDVDQQYTTQPTGTLATSIMNTLTIRGQGAIQSHNATVVVNPKLSDKVSNPIYRKDYNVGDTIYVAGQLMRVSEYVEAEDHTGETGYPTFTDPGDLNV